jgi:hypothetical protein
MLLVAARLIVVFGFRRGVGLNLIDLQFQQQG